MAVDEFGREIPAPQQPWRGDADYGRGGEHSNRRSSPRQAPRRPSSSSSRQSPRHAQHPSFQYVKEPLLCEYLWKKQQQDDEQKEEEEKSQEGESKESDNNDNQDTPYDLYRRKYCLNYVRAFFNQHLDDSWFRARYSPAVRQAWLDQEQARAVTEARAILTSIKQDATTFIAQAALSSGHKDPNQVVAIPKSHLFAWQQESSPQQALLVTEIPAAVTDNQLMIALQNLVQQQQQDVDLQVYSSCQVVTGDNTKILQRQALVVGQAAVIQEILAAGNKLEVDCSDPYGRLQYDADNRGGAPADGLAVPCRKARVVVSLASNILNLTTTLSAAVSVQARFTQDTASAQQMAVLLDEQRHVPVDCQWNTLQQALTTTTESDALDVCIAYLRRVHLVSFYHSAHQPAECVADMFGSKQHAIHLRLASAEDVLASSSKSGLVETSTQEEAKDLLVQRLDDSIAQALETFAAAPPTTTRPQQVAEIHQAEQDVRNDWLRNHSLIDTDNRARCSFHFCHKLFKDTSFLHKHLLKKHVEYLLAEQAASHDSYMMQAWDAATSRPVPDILVDCGTRFGWVAASVTGVPDCVDPEPGLWQREEERRERDMKARREETRQQALAAPPPPLPPTNNPRPSNYVDVDDMKEEKVELSFDNVDVPKKKKKKRKLL